jgi:hypothetical protein
MADDSFDSLSSDASGAQDDRRDAGYIEHCRFESDAGSPCIQNQGDAATKIVEGMLGGGRTG